jgi:hypothetical protein
MPSIVLYHRASLWKEAQAIVDGGFLFSHVDEKGTGMYACMDPDRWLGGEVQFRIRLKYRRLADYWDNDIQDAIATYYRDGVAGMDALLDALGVDAIAHGPDVKIRPGANLRTGAFRRLGIRPSRWLRLDRDSAHSRACAHLVISHWYERWDRREKA